MTPRAVRRGIGLLGGTFDPVHSGHLAAARAALDALPVVRVDFLPAGNPWQKNHFSDGEHRLNMLRLAVEYEPRFRVDTSELCRPGATYTIDTLRRLRQAVGPAMPLILILGSDQWNNLSTWRDWSHLTDYAHLALCARGDHAFTAVPEAQQHWSSPRMADPAALAGAPAGLITEFSMSPHCASSTVIRNTLASLPFAEAVRRLDGWLPVGVAQYIRSHRLYGAGRRP